MGEEKEKEHHLLVGGMVKSDKRWRRRRSITCWLGGWSKVTKVEKDYFDFCSNLIFVAF